jgi:hypothetical protein
VGWHKAANWRYYQPQLGGMVMSDFAKMVHRPPAGWARVASRSTKAPMTSNFRSFHLTGVAAALLATALAGCANINDLMLQVGTSRPTATLQVGAQRLQGNITLTPERHGELSVQAAGGKPSACMGALRFTSTQAGTMNLQCDDGTATTLYFSLLTPVKGYAYGQTEQSTVALTFGMAEEESAAYLFATAPAEAVAPAATMTPTAQPAAQ